MEQGKRLQLVQDIDHLSNQLTLILCNTMYALATHSVFIFMVFFVYNVQNVIVIVSELPIDFLGEGKGGRVGARIKFYKRQD